MSKNEVVTNKRVILNSPGHNISDIYYRDESTRVSDIETLSIQGRFIQSLNLNWGATSNIQIANSGNILHQCFLHIKLPPLQENEFVNRGFLYNCIDSLSWTLGSSTMSQIRYDQKTIFHTAMLMMNTDEYRSMALVVAGDQHVNSTVNPIEGTLILPLPWSSLRSAEDSSKKGIDTSLLNTQINIQITLSQASKVYGGTAVHPPPLECYIYTREEVLSNQALSIRSALMSNSQEMYSYPFIHRQSITPKNMMSEVPSTISLAEFLESDLQAISFTAHLVEDQSNLGGFAPNVLLPIDCIDLELKYNGQTLWSAPGRGSRLVQSLYDGGASSFKHSRIRRTSTISGAPSDEINAYINYIPIASMFQKNVNYEAKYSNSPRFSNQTMSLELTALNPPNVTGSQAVIVYVTYYYSAVAELSSGISTITFA